MTNPAKKASPRKAPAKKAAATAPKQSADATPSTKGVASLYPKGTELFEWTSKSGIKIVFPKFGTKQVDRVFFWKLYQLEPVFQGFEWMAEYAVPLEIQAVAVTLADDEYQELFDAWFADAQLTAGE